MAILVLASVLILGSAGYMLIEGWSAFDSLYMTVITVGTVGFAEVEPLSEAGRAFTIGLILVGFGALVFALGTFVDFIVEGHLKGIVEGHRMQSSIEKLTDHHIIAGIGRVGSVVARSLADERVPFVVIDQAEECIARARDEGWLVVEGDASDEETLTAAGIDRARSLITALDSDADNLFVTFTARSMSPGLFIVARSSSEASEAKLRKAGANRVLTPNVIGGRRMAGMALHPVVSDYLDLVTHGDAVEFRLQEVEVGVNSAFSGKSIKESQVRDATGAFILAVHSGEGGVNTNPSSDTVMRPGDRLVVLGTCGQIDALMRAMG